MPESSPPLSAVGELRQALAEMKSSDIWRLIVEPRDAVFARFQPVFQPAHLPQLSEEEFRPFFYFENNHHWTSLYRQVNRICSDMPRLRSTLAKLLDESRPIRKRLDEVDGCVTGMGKGIMTAILTVAYPQNYGVWNNVSEAGLVKLGVWPKFERGASFGARYLEVNTILQGLAAALGIDLWTLDALWWQYSRSDELPTPAVGAGDGDTGTAGSTDQRFGLERHLQDFLFDNWDRTALGKDWAIYAEPGDAEAGYEYPCEVGRIDILATHRREKKWLVVELKRGDTSDSVVGQALRYMGWVKHNLAAPGEQVHGLIIARDGDAALHYAVSTVPNVAFMTYEVEFRLKPPPPLGKGSRP